MMNYEDIENEILDSEEGLLELTEEELSSISGGTTVIHVKRGTLNVHSGPGKNYSVLATVDKHDDLVCVGEAQKDKNGKYWIKIRVFGIVGWVRGDKTK